MTVLLVLSTLIIFLAVDHFVQKARAARAAAALQPRSIALPEGICLATNHTWIKEQKGVATIGFDEFIGGMLGVVESIVLPEAGNRITTQNASISLRHRDRTLHMAAPVEGKIMEVNTSVLQNPALARTDPYGKGWLLKIRTDANAAGRPRLVFGMAARQWLKEQTDLAKEFLAGQVAAPQLATLQDGGTPADGVLQQCDARVWREFERRFTGVADTDRITK
jgi:glycine cleavage system H protein